MKFTVFIVSSTDNLKFSVYTVTLRMLLNYRSRISVSAAFFLQQWYNKCDSHKIFSSSLTSLKEISGRLVYVMMKVCMLHC